MSASLNDDNCDLDEQSALKRIRVRYKSDLHEALEHLVVAGTVAAVRDDKLL